MFVCEYLFCLRKCVCECEREIMKNVRRENESGRERVYMCVKERERERERKERFERMVFRWKKAQKKQSFTVRCIATV